MTDFTGLVMFFFSSHVQPLIMFAYSRVGVYLKGFNSYPAELVKRAVEYFFSSVYIRLHMHKKGQNEVAGGRFISEKCLDTNNVEGEIQM